MRRLLSLFLLAFVPALPASPVARLESPDRRLAVEFKLTDTGAPVYVILRDGSPVLRESRPGLAGRARS